MVTIVTCRRNHRRRRFCSGDKPYAVAGVTVKWLFGMLFRSSVWKVSGPFSWLARNNHCDRQLTFQPFSGVYPANEVAFRPVAQRWNCGVPQ
jgi:hypothetical protein